MPFTGSSVHVHSVAGRSPGAGSVLAVFTDGPSDPAVARTAAALAGGTGTLLVAAAAVPGTGLSINPLLHQARARRRHTESVAIVARVTPILSTAGVGWLRTTLPVPAGPDPARLLPVAAVRRLAGRLHAAVVVTAAPLPDPSGFLSPVSAAVTRDRATVRPEGRRSWSRP
jgi:hypothetical protein